MTDVAKHLNKEEGTFNNFDTNLPLEELERIDYIFASKEFEVVNYKTHYDTRSNNLYLSDHFMISSTLKIKN